MFPQHTERWNASRQPFILKKELLTSTLIRRGFGTLRGAARCIRHITMLSFL